MTNLSVSEVPLLVRALRGMWEGRTVGQPDHKTQSALRLIGETDTRVKGRCEREDQWNGQTLKKALVMPLWPSPVSPISLV